jgi:hypothetical protein
MMKTIFGLAVVMGAMSGTAMAGDRDHGFGDFDHRDKGFTMSAPEIDPASAMSALTMLAGGLVVVRGRRSKK